MGPFDEVDLFALDVFLRDLLMFLNVVKNKHAFVPLFLKINMLF